MVLPVALIVSGILCSTIEFIKLRTILKSPCSKSLCGSAIWATLGSPDTVARAKVEISLDDKQA